MRILLICLLSFSLRVYSRNVGTSLFNNKRIRYECWSDSDLAKLRARRVFENLALPTPSPQDINAKYIEQLIKYYDKALKSTQNQNDPQNANIMKDSLADFIGGHLRYDMLPASRLAYYAGYVPYRNVRQLHDFYDDIKGYLNTQGSGWKVPPRIPRCNQMAVAKVLVDRSILHNPCKKIVYRKDSDSCIHLPKPKVDDEKNPLAIALPFKNNGLYSLTSPRSEDIVLKYYTTASKCILRESPRKCRHSDFEAFNTDLWHWMKKDVAPHLGEEKLYSGFGDILRVAASVQSYGKGLKRRNLFETENGSDSWRPWRALNNNNVYMDYDWTPQIYVIFVMVAALAICLFQICQHYIFTKSCNCLPSPINKDKKTCPTDVAYTAVDSNIPAILPHHQQTAVLVSDHPERIPRKLAKSKAASSESFNNQRVYDLNESTEKIMPVIMSDDEKACGARMSLVPSVQEILSDESEEREMSTLTVRSSSPPKIRAEVTQRFSRVSSVRKDLVRDSSSTYSYCESRGRRRAASESAWSGSESSSSSSSSRTHRTGRPRSSTSWSARPDITPSCSNSRRSSTTPLKETS